MRRHWSTDQGKQYMSTPPSPFSSPIRATNLANKILRLRTIASTLSNLSGQARRRTIGCGRRASVSAIQGIGGAWSGEPVVACNCQATSGSTSCNRTAVSRPPQLSATAPSTVSAHPGDHTFPSCTAGSTPRPSEDAALFQC